MKQKLDPYVLSFSAIFIALYFLTGTRLFEDTSFPIWFKWVGWIYLFIHYALGLWTPLVYWRRDYENGPDKVTEIILGLSNISLGTVSYLVVLVLLRDFIWVFTRWAWMYGNSASLVILGLTYFFLALGAYLALKTPSVHLVELAFKELPKNFDGFKIVQLSDLHISPMVREGFVRRVVDEVNRLDADMVAVTGDMFDDEPKHLSQHSEPLKDIKSKNGVYFVTGNHEYYWDHKRAVEAITALGFRVLYNENVKIEKGAEFIKIAGVPDLNSKKIAPQTAEGLDHEKALKGTESDFTVLLAHHPKVVFYAARYKVNLQLSGHTHGGQFYPWNYLSKMIYGYYKGLNFFEGVQLYVSKGTGYWGPPNRLGATPEITLITLKKS